MFAYQFIKNQKIQGQKAVQLNLKIIPKNFSKNLVEIERIEPNVDDLTFKGRTLLCLYHGTLFNID